MRRRQKVRRDVHAAEEVVIVGEQTVERRVEDLGLDDGAVVGVALHEAVDGRQARVRRVVEAKICHKTQKSCIIESQNRNET